jgi:putative sigma-54 modulation protein
MLIRDRNVELAEDGRKRIERSLRFALSRFGRRIRRVTMSLTDLNGPRGGVDKRCRVEVALEPRGAVFIEEDGSDIHAAVDRAAERLARVVDRQLDREREVDGTAARERPGAKE